MEPEEAHDPARPRVVLLGASNLTRGVSTVVETAQRLLGGPLDVYAALGHGRSYGTKSLVVVRSLPSIAGSRLWDVLADSPAAPTYALVSDIGNDVMYGHDPELIAEWIGACVDRLLALRARIVLAGLPMQSVERLRNWHYVIARSIFFPSNHFSLDEVKHRAQRVIRLVESLATRHGIPFVALTGTWYGADPIHIRRRFWAEAWPTILHPWKPEAPVPEVRGSLRRWIRLRSLSPERWWLLGMKRGRSQPASRLADGTTVSLY